MRLYDIDCPKSNQPYVMWATRFSKMMARFERVEIERKTGTNMGGSWPWSTSRETVGV